MPNEFDKWEVCESDFVIEKEIGSGSFGKVYKGILQLSANTPMIERYKLQMMSNGESVYTVAIKVIKSE